LPTEHAAEVGKAEHVVFRLDLHQRVRQYTGVATPRRQRRRP
jgi:hypothetical protein